MQLYCKQGDKKREKYLLGSKNVVLTDGVYSWLVIKACSFIVVFIDI